MKTGLKRIDIDGGDMAFAIVTSRWNSEMTSRLSSHAQAALIEAGVGDANIVHFAVPGAFELPLASKRAAASGKFDAVIALGVVIRGDTPHFEYVAGQAAAGLMQASLDTGTPIMFGVVTADTIEQAVARTGENADNKGYEAAVSALEMATLMRTLG